MKTAKEMVEASIVPEGEWQFTFEQECRLEAMKAAGSILYAGRISPPTIYEIFELIHYLDHWMSSGVIPQDPKSKFRVVDNGP